MKAKLYLAIVVSMLLSLIAFPALAQGAVTPMWVCRAHLSYVGRSSTGTDAVMALIFVRDADRQRLKLVEVSVRWTLPDGTTYPPPETLPEPVLTDLTDLQGIARFSIWEGPGEYALSVVSVVTADGEVLSYCPASVSIFADIPFRPLTAR